MKGKLFKFLVGVAFYGWHFFKRFLVAIVMCFPVSLFPGFYIERIFGVDVSGLYVNSLLIPCLIISALWLAAASFLVSRPSFSFSDGFMEDFKFFCKHYLHDRDFDIVLVVSLVLGVCVRILYGFYVFLFWLFARYYAYYLNKKSGRLPDGDESNQNLGSNKK